MHIWENKIVKIDIFCDVSSDIFDDLNSFDIVRKFVKSHKCKELEYLRQTDELILFTCADNTKLLLQATTGVNGSVVLHFDENHIDKILSNEPLVGASLRLVPRLLIRPFYWKPPIINKTPCWRKSATCAMIDLV